MSATTTVFIASAVNAPPATAQIDPLGAQHATLVSRIDKLDAKLTQMLTRINVRAYDTCLWIINLAQQNSQTVAARYGALDRCRGEWFRSNWPGTYRGLRYSP